MRSALKLPPRRMTVAEFLDWNPDGTWPERPELLGPDDELRLDSIGFATPLRAAYRTSGLL